MDYEDQREIALESLKGFSIPGMLAIEVKASWGQPDSRYVADEGIEFWHYKPYTLYFKNFRLEAYVKN